MHSNIPNMFTTIREAPYGLRVQPKITQFSDKLNVLSFANSRQLMSLKEIIWLLYSSAWGLCLICVYARRSHQDCSIMHWYSIFVSKVAFSYGLEATSTIMPSVSHKMHCSIFAKRNKISVLLTMKVVIFVVVIFESRKRGASFVK